MVELRHRSVLTQYLRHKGLKSELHNQRKRLSRVMQRICAVRTCSVRLRHPPDRLLDERRQANICYALHENAYQWHKLLASFTAKPLVERNHKRSLVEQLLCEVRKEKTPNSV